MKKILIGIIIVIAFIVIYAISPKVEDEEDIENSTTEISSQSECDGDLDTENEKKSEAVEQSEATEVVKEYAEDEYKAMCREIFYDEVFFGDDNLEGKYVKLHLLLSEKYYFDNDVIYSDTYKEYFEKYHMNRDFYKCCVLKEDSNSYVGNQINMWFSENFDLNPKDYETGQKVMVYAEVISWSDSTWEGYNSVTVIPRYIEIE